jgi:hypothetical protein
LNDELREMTNNSRKRTLGDVLSDAVGEELLLGLAAHVVEQQHRDPGLSARASVAPVATLRAAGRPPRPAQPRGVDAERAHRLRQVLQRLLAHVVEAHPQTMAQRALDRLGHAHAARFGERLEPRRGVHAIAVDAAVGHLDHVAEVDTDPKPHPARLLLRRGARRDLVLHRQRRADRAGRGLEHREHRVAGHVDHAALLGADVACKHLARGVERRNRASSSLAIRRE